MKLYIANCTNQMRVVNTRPPEHRNVWSQPIDVGQQALYISANLNRLQIDAIIEQQGVYGLRSCNDFEHAREKGALYEMLYNIDEPVPYKMHLAACEWNEAVLRARGKRLREEAAIATSRAMGGPNIGTPNAANQLQMSVQEETPATDHEPVNEGVRIDPQYGVA